ncbi:hypothetical protein LC040_14930 [Bacillus tianshenii]|nr:hypothetical protein LC040_14930 [Bacillus tianshenii]
MKIKLLSLAIGGLLALNTMGGAASAANIIADTNTEKPQLEERGFHQGMKQHFARGMGMKGQHVQFHKEHLLQKAKELGIETEGKELQDVANEVRQAAMNTAAKELGIEVADKTPQELHQAIHEAKILQAAEKLGVKTEGRELNEVMADIHTNHAEEAREMGLFGKMKQHRMKGQHGKGMGGYFQNQS